MAQRDPEKTARNKLIKSMSNELKALAPYVLSDTNIPTIHSINGMIGHKNEYFIDLEKDVIHSPDQYVSMWLDGLKKAIEKTPKQFRGIDDTKYEIYQFLKKYKSYREYHHLFLKRTYLRNYEALAKKRPPNSDAEIWIGQKNASYGILVTPRFVDGKWENDKSEIRHFDKKYWSIGHILKTGLVIPRKNEKMTFNSPNEYLKFFRNVIVRNSGSPYELEIAEKYSGYVVNHSNPEGIPLLIPEYRYGGLSFKHEHRLDFTIIESSNLNKFGFELSPWSTHGKLKSTKRKTQKLINQEASQNFEKEISKLRKYFKRFNIYTLVYSDESLKNIDEVFADMKKYLEPSMVGEQLKFLVYESIMKSDL